MPPYWLAGILRLGTIEVSTELARAAFAAGEQALGCIVFRCVCRRSVHRKNEQQ